MQKENLIRSLRQLLLSLNDDELQVVLNQDVLDRLGKPVEASVNKNKEKAKANVLSRLKDLGIERFNDVKGSISDTVDKIDFSDLKNKIYSSENKTRSEDTKEVVVRNNPFLKMQNQKNTN